MLREEAMDLELWNYFLSTMKDHSWTLIILKLMSIKTSNSLLRKKLKNKAKVYKMKK
jgi:hypothetical protein